MAEKIRPELLSFLQPNAALLRVLVVESLSYLPELRRMFPQAELYAVTADMDAMEMDLTISYLTLRWRRRTTRRILLRDFRCFSRRQGHF